MVEMKGLCVSRLGAICLFYAAGHYTSGLRRLFGEKERYGESMALHEDLVRILVCPVCRGELIREDRDEGLLCPACAKVYPVREDIPVMLCEEAVPLREWRNGKREVCGTRIPSLEDEG